MRMGTLCRAALPALLAGLVLAAATPAARAGAVLDHVRADKTIRCGAAARPGLLDPQASGAPAGLFVDLCRAIGTLVAGPAVRVVIDIDDAGQDATALRAGRDDIAFLTGAEIVDDKLAGAVVPGPPVFFETSALMVAAGSPVQKPADLAGQPICFLQGEPVERHLEAWFAARAIPFVRMGYQEEVERDDAFDAQQCHALAGAATTLATIRREGGPNRRGGRILVEPLATVPILAVTGTGDGAWTALVAWSIASLQNADRPTRDWAAGGLDSLPLPAVEAGLPGDWQRRLVSLGGSYAALLRRSTGESSPLGLAPGPNALADQGGLLRPVDAE